MFLYGSNPLNRQKLKLLGPAHFAHRRGDCPAVETARISEPGEYGSLPRRVKAFCWCSKFFLSIDVADVKDSEFLFFFDLENWLAANSTALQVGFCGMHTKHGELHPLSSSYFIFANGRLFSALGIDRSKSNLVLRSGYLFTCP